MPIPSRPPPRSGSGRRGDSECSRPTTLVTRPTRNRATAVLRMIKYEDDEICYRIPGLRILLRGGAGGGENRRRENRRGLG